MKKLCQINRNQQVCLEKMNLSATTIDIASAIKRIYVIGDTEKGLPLTDIIEELNVYK